MQSHSQEILLALMALTKAKSCAARTGANFESAVLDALCQQERDRIEKAHCYQAEGYILRQTEDYFIGYPEVPKEADEWLMVQGSRRGTRALIYVTKE